ncbi:MAG: DUF2079 domain-containing protein, partial [Bdellovibrionota bacterium]
MRLKGRSWTIGWDLIFAILIAFPLLTGGAWIRRPGLVLELSDLAVPTLVLGALTALVHRLVDWQRSLFYRAGLRAWKFWNARLASSPLKTLLAASLGMGALWSLASLRRHWAFESHSFDLGIFTNTLWNLVHGHGYVSSPKDGINLFQDHQSPILMMFAPLFALFPAPETLLIAQALALAASGAVLFGLARPYFARGHWLPAALPILYWLYRPVRNANAFDFHPEVLMLPFFLTGLWLGQRRQRLARVGAVVAFLLALACKESAGVVAVGLGAAWMLGAGPKETRKFTRTLGLGLALSGLAVFLFDYEIVPRFFGSQYLYSGAYDQYGNGLSAVLLA